MCDVILAGYGLTVEDEERSDAGFFPTGEVLVDVVIEAGETTEGGEERFVCGRDIQKLAEIVGRIHSQGAILELGDVVCAMTQS